MNTHSVIFFKFDSRALRTCRILLTESVPKPVSASSGGEGYSSYGGSPRGSSVPGPAVRMIDVLDARRNRVQKRLYLSGPGDGTVVGIGVRTYRTVTTVNKSCAFSPT